MEKRKFSTNEITWTWADQISTYKFWGIFFFFIFLLIPNAFMNFSYLIFRDSLGMSNTQFNTVMVSKSLGALGGLWLAWLMVRMKNHYLLFLYSGFTIIGLILVLIMPSITTLSICLILIGLSFSAISLAIPAIISGGKGGGEMFVVSFGIISFFELIAWTFSNSLFGILFKSVNHNSLIIICLVSSLIAAIFLLPVKAELFYNTPPERKKLLTPTWRKPVIVALLCFVPLYNIYYILHLSYRLHGEINQINPTQNILSPRSAVWSTLFLSFLSPIIVSSLNTNLCIKLKENNASRFHKTWAVTLWSFIFTPVSYALIQSNLNYLIQNHSND